MFIINDLLCYGVAANGNSIASQVIDPTVRKVMEITATQRAGEYRDRAAERRERYGVDHVAIANQARKQRGGQDFVPENNVTSVHKHIETSKNVGGKLMQKMGWTEGQALGKSGEGIAAPINATEQRNKKVGLGHQDSKKKERNKDYRKGVKQAAADRFNSLWGAGAGRR